MNQLVRMVQKRKTGRKVKLMREIGQGIHFANM